MIDGKELARSGCKYIGTPYARMDCQELWEKMLSDCGLKMDLGGSNSWYRYMNGHGWVGTPEECNAVFGCIPKAATLFIREEVSASTPAQFRDDGIGDITHMGVYTAMTGAEMCDLAIGAGIGDADQYNFGNGAIHSSSSKGYVCTSKFNGKTIPNGGWNRVGLLPEMIMYAGIDQDDGPIDHDDDPIAPEPPPEPELMEPEFAIVTAASGSNVKMRAKPSTSCRLWWNVPLGSEVIVDSWGDEWSKITWNDREGYMQTCFLNKEAQTATWTVTIPMLTIYQADALLERYPGSYKTKEGG